MTIRLYYIVLYCKHQFNECIMYLFFMLSYAVGTIENFMESKARSTFDEWMTLAKLFCQEMLALCVIEDERHLSNENLDYFYDVGDTLTSFSTPSSGVKMNGVLSPMQKTDQTRVANGILSRFKSVFSTATESMDASCMQIILREMNEIEISCRVVQGHVEKLNVEMLQMDDNVKKMNEEMLKIRYDIQCMRLVMEKKQDQVLIPRREGLTLVVGLATGFALGYAYMKVRSRS